jgi:hypothetical protein
MPGKTNDKKRTKAYFGKVYIEITDSTLVDKVFYDPETCTLDAVFKKRGGGEGARYRYRRVPAKVFAQFVLANSKGQFFNKNIKKGYVVEKIEG